MTISQHECRWTPASEVRDHNGEPIPRDACFFAPPPVEIGTVITAHSGLRGGRWASSKAAAQKVVWLFTLFGALVGGFIGAGLASASGSVLAFVISTLVGAVLIGVPIYRREAARNVCTYVGTHGIARRGPGGSDACRRGEVMLFADATELQTAFLGRNMGTNFNYQWKDDRRKTLFKLEGGLYGDRSAIDPDSLYLFALAAEETWTQCVLARAAEEMKRTGSIRFLTRRALGNEQSAIIGPGYLDIVNPGRQYHNLASELEDVVQHQGFIIIRRKDARDRAINSLDGANGIFYFSYGSISNVKAFLVALRQVVGIRSD